VFAVVLDGIEDVGEVPGGVGGANLGHLIRLSDLSEPEQPRTGISPAWLGRAGCRAFGVS
jgi:hypothetical protein